MNILGMLAASWLCAAPVSAPHAKIAAARPAGASAAAKAPAAVKPVRRVTEAKVDAVHRETIVRRRRRTAYWDTFCLNHPAAAECREDNFAGAQNVERPATPSVVLNPYATTTQAPGPASVLAAPAAFRAPDKPIVKVSDELAAGVAVGATQADILQKLGEPHSRISGDIDRYTYFLESGGSLKLDFEDGRVAEVRRASN